MYARTGLVVSGGIIALMLAVTAWAWAALPADVQLPVHWGIDGAADRYGGKAEALLAVPAITLVTALLLAVAPKMEPRRAHLEQSGTAYVTVWIAIILELAVLHGALVLSALGYAVNVAAVIMGGVGLLFMVIGRVLGDVHSNFIFGVRTPWTLSSERSWQRTHQLAGKLFMALGASIALLALVAPAPTLFAVLMGGVGVILAVVLVYSWQVWRTDPARQS